MVNLETTLDAHPSRRPSLAMDSPIPMHRLTYLHEGDDVTVGRLEEGGFVVLPKDGADLLRRLENGATPRQAAQWYLESFGEAIDISDFVADLVELGFVRPEGVQSSDATPVRWMRLGRAVFSPVGATVYAVVLVTFVVTAIRTPAIVPHYSNIFFTHYISVLLLILFLGQLPLILLHETAHALAGRRLGLRSTLSIGRRLHFVVFETTMDGLVAVPRAKRLLPILAGVCADIGIVAILSVFAAALRRSDGSFPLPAALALALAYMTVIRILWQGRFFLQTDLYYLIVTALGCVDLQTTAKQLLNNVGRRLIGRPARFDPQDWHPRDRRAARWYAILIVVGYGIAIGTLLLGLLPAAVRVFSEVGARLIGQGSKSGLEVLDGVVFLVLSIGELALAGYLLGRERRNARRPAPPALDNAPTHDVPA